MGDGMGLQLTEETSGRTRGKELKRKERAKTTTQPLTLAPDDPLSAASGIKQ